MKSSQIPVDNLIEHTLHVWSSRLGRALSREDARQILENVSGFFKILVEWSQDGRSTPADDSGVQHVLQHVEGQTRSEAAAADDGERGRSRP